MPSNEPPAVPKTSAYSRSRTFRLGVWALAVAGAIIGWHAIKDAVEAGKGKLSTLQGTVLEYRSSETAGGTVVRMPGGGSNRIQGDRKRTTYLRIQKSDGTVAEFTEPEWYPTPKAGWQGQPIRVQHDAFRNLYEIEVAGEVIRDAATTRKYRKIDSKKSEPLMVFLIVAGVPLTAIGYLLSLRGSKQPQP